MVLLPHIRYTEIMLLSTVLLILNVRFLSRGWKDTRFWTESNNNAPAVTLSKLPGYLHPICEYFVLRWMARHLQTLMLKVENYCTHLYIYNCIKLSPSREPNKSSDTQEIICILRNPKVYYVFRNPPPPASIPSQFNPVHTSPCNFFSIYFNIILPFTPSSFKWSLPSGPSPTKALYAPLLSPTRATCPAHLILIHFITRIIHGEKSRA